ATAGIDRQYALESNLGTGSVVFQKCHNVRAMSTESAGGKSSSWQCAFPQANLADLSYCPAGRTRWLIRDNTV
ncbi:MAG: hypothetical protein JXB60_07420, partial [Candidatus Cloacimonetes bacterium]|nr:hypothetical protein [Candidatus Cloacimonadota bacterium]